MKMLLVLLSAFTISGAGAAMISDVELSSFDVPGNCQFPFGIAYDSVNDHLYITDSIDDQLFELETDGTLVDYHNIGSGGEYYAGLGYDGSSLWAIGKTSKDVFEIDPDDGSVLSSFSLSADSPSSVVFWSDLLYVSNNTDANPYIYLYSTTGSLQNYFLSYAKYPSGIDIINHDDDPTSTENLVPYIFNLGYADGYMVIHDLSGTGYPELHYHTDSSCGSVFGGDIAFKENKFDIDGTTGTAHMWHVDPLGGSVNYLEVTWETDPVSIKSASLGQIKSLFR